MLIPVSGTAFSILRFASFFRGSAVADGTWDSVDLIYWTIIEPGVYLIAACLPTFRPVFIRLLKGTPLLSVDSTTPYRSGGGKEKKSPDGDCSGLREGPDFQRFGESKNSTVSTQYGDTVGLVQVNVEANSMEAPVPGHQIRVRNEYDVSFARG